MWKSTTGSHTGAMEFVIRIVHLVTAENGLQAALVKSFVVGHEWQTLNQRLYLLPYFWEDWCLFRILSAEAVDLAAPIIIVVRLRLNQRIERIYNLTIPDYHHANGAHAGPLVVGCFKIDCCEVIQTTT